LDACPARGRWLHPKAARGAPRQAQLVVGEFRIASDVSVSAIAAPSAIYAISAIYS
jgi:hypothetical protein